MNFFSLIGIEFKKIRRSKILWILLAAVIILWLPSIFNAHMNFEMQDTGISPQSNFLIQGFMGMAWFMFPACIILSTVLLNQTERGNKGILKMLALPVEPARLCLAKFVVLLCLTIAQILMTAGMYFVSAAIASQTQNYAFILSPLIVFKEAGLICLSSIPMMSFFWLLSICIQTPIFSVGLGLAAIVPSVLMINTKIWFAYPMCYPFYIITSEYGRMASNLSFSSVEFFPWLPVAIGITAICLIISCLCFGQAERR